MMFCPRHDAAFSLRPFVPSSPSSSNSLRRSQRQSFRPLKLELLEPRLALSADVATNFDDLLTHGGACACPICSGAGLEQLVAPQAAETVAAATTTSTTTSLASIPQLSSNSAARAKLYLDFNGHVQGTWGSWSNVRTPAFDQDGNASSFSSAEIAAIREIWARVAEDYAPFNIDVTTVEPSSFADRTAVRVAVGGNWSDWFGSSAGGVAYVGAFTSAAPNIAFVFAKALGGGNARYVAEAAAHEAGHLFGLSHQSTYAGSALAQPYNSGTSTLAPIMGVGYYASRSTWFNGPTDAGPASYQNDVSILSSANNGFGLRPDDFGDTTAAAATLAVQSGAVTVKGIIEDYQDSDVWKFTTGGGTARFTLNVAQFGANLDAMLELKNAAGQIVASASPTGSFGASLSATLASGTYYVVARANGGYGNMGQYTLTGTVPLAGTTSGSTTTSGAPEITVAVNGSQVADGGQVNFGTTTVGTSVSRTITISNSGTKTLTLTRPSSVPAGYSIASNLGLTSLSPGQSTSLTIRLNATSAGSFAGRVVVASNDANEGQYDLNLSGAVRSATTTTTTTTTSTSSTKRILDNGQSGYTGSGAWSTRTGSGRDSDLQTVGRASSGTTATARWNFSSLPAGSYRVWMTWTGGSGNASNAPISFYDGSRLVRTVTVDQRAAASGFTADGSNWKLITTLSISGSQLAVQLGNNANGSVIADAVRIERVVAAAPEVAESMIGDAPVGGIDWDVMSASPLRTTVGRHLPASSKTELLTAPVDAAFAEDIYWQRVATAGVQSVDESLACMDDGEDDAEKRIFSQDEFFGDLGIGRG